MQRTGGAISTSMGDRAPNTETGEPETGADALLDELVRALARQMAERDYEALRNKTRGGDRPSGGKKGSKMSAAAIYARYSSDLQREASIEDQNRPAANALQKKVVCLQMLQRPRHIRREPDPARHPEAVAGCAGRPI